MDKYIGRLLDNRYEILEVIGTGGMAVVYKARCHRLNRLVAIKILKDDYLEDEDFRRRFHAESQAVAMLGHPNIVSVYDVSTSISMEADYIVMELIEGITLKQYMEKKGVLNWKETLHFAMQIAKALEHAHSRGVVHRDIKPHNVMVLKNGSVKVADFGIARMMSKGDTLTKEALGSVHYISPEQAKGGRVDNRSDIYSLGVVMYEMMSGRPPYEGDSPVAVAIQHINGGAVKPSALNPNIPAGIEKIIMKAMAKELSDRYATATQMLSDMEEFRQNPVVLFDSPTGPIPETGKNPKPPIVLVNPEKTAADRVAERAQANRNRKPNPANGRKQPPQKPQQESGSNRVVISAILICCVALLLSILLILWLTIGGGSSGSGENKVPVPNLIGKYYDALKEYDGLRIEMNDQSVYHDEFEAGQIIDQNPKSDTIVVEGTTVHVTVSLGKKPEIIYMPDLLQMTESQAEYALNATKLDLNVVWGADYSDTIPAKSVIRTDPEEGAELHSGQTVTVVLSQGKKETVKNVSVKKVVGMTLAEAIDVLTGEDQQFPMPEFTFVFSDEEIGKVVSQSVKANTVVPNDTVIQLEVSKGPDDEEPEITMPDTTVPETTIHMETKTVTFDLTEHIDDSDVLVLIHRDGEEIFRRYLGMENPVVTLQDQKGTGVVHYEVFVGEEKTLVWEEDVTFSTNG